MLRRLFSIVVLLNLAFFFPASPAAAKAETFNYKFKGLFADAYFSITDESGCIETASYLTASDGLNASDIPAKDDSFIYIVVYQYDLCAGEYLLDAWGDSILSRDAFTIKNQLNTAELQTTVVVEDLISGAKFPLEIQLAWTATGEGFRAKEHNHIHEPGLKVNYRYTAFVRPAVASGSITGVGINFAGMPTESAQMSNVKAGFVEVTMTP